MDYSHIFDPEPFPKPSTPFLFSRYLLLLALLFWLLGAAKAHAEQPFEAITQRDGLPSNGITALAWQNETLWVGTIAGLGKWQATERRAMTVEFPLDERHLLALYHDGEALWVGTADGIARDGGDGWQTWQRGQDGLTSDWATSFVRYQGMLLVGTYGGGVQGWTGSEWQTMYSSAPLQVTALASHGQQLWAGTPRGLSRWDGKRWQEERLPFKPLAVKALAVADEHLWLASDRGLFYRQLEVPTGWQATSFDDMITAIAYHQEGLVAATLNKLLQIGETATNTLPINFYVSSLLFTDKQLFIGTMNHGLMRFPLDTLSPPVRQPLEPLQVGGGAQAVVLLHGLGDSNDVQASNLRFLARWLKRDGYTVRMVSYNDQMPLLEKVAAVKQTVIETGHDEVILIAHSFGGLVAKAYLASGASDVAGLVTVGTPHAGVQLAYNLLVMDLPTDKRASIRELLPEHLKLIAPFMESAQVPQLHIGGDILPRDNLLAGFPPNDGIITAASATAAPGSIRLVKALHAWTLATLQFGIPSYLWPDDLYVNTIRPWLQRLPDVPLEKSPAATTEAGFTQWSLIDKTLEAGETVTGSFSLTEQPATWLLNAPGVAMDLIAPDGKRYGSERFLLGDTIAHLPYRENLLQAVDLWSTRRRPGLWQAQLSNQSNTAVRSHLTLIEPSATALNFTISSLDSSALPEPWVREGTLVTIELQGESNQSYFATLAQAESRLIEDKVGHLSATLRAPTTSGYYPVRVSKAALDSSVSSQPEALGLQVPLLERWAVVGVYDSNWRVTAANVTPNGNAVILVLTFTGSHAGQVALGLRLLEDGQPLLTRLVGPFAYDFAGSNTLTQAVPIPPTASRERLSLEWHLFDASGVLVPTGEQAVLQIKR